MAEFARGLIDAYSLGESQRQAEDKLNVEARRRSAMDAYAPGALRGDQSSIESLAANGAPDAAMQFSQFASQHDAAQIEKSKRTWGQIEGLIRRPDGSLIQTPEETAHALSMAKAMNIDIPPEVASQITPEAIPQIANFAQMIRGYTPEARAKDELSRRQAESSIRANDALANQRGMVGGRGGPVGKAPSGYHYVLGEDGQASLEFIPGGPADPAIKPLTDEQAKAAGFASRLRDSDSRLGSKEVSDALLGGYDNTVADIPLGIGNALVSNEYQIGDQARRDFLNAQLRRESGAVIGASEFGSGTKQYFPNYGDKQAVLMNKALSRKQAIYNMLVSAGPRYAKDAEDARREYIALHQKIAASAKAKPQASSTNHIDEADRIVGIKK